MQALSAAVLRARVYPPAAQGRGLMGTARVYLEIARDGSLLAGRPHDLERLGQPRPGRPRRRASGPASPSAPDDLPGESFAFMQDLEFRAR